MTVSDLIAILQKQDQDAVVVGAEGLELRPADVQAVQLTPQVGKSWGGYTHGAKEWAVDDDGETKGVQIA